MKKIPIVDYEGYLNIDGNCCPECGGTRITIHEQRNLQVDRNLSSGKAIKLCDGKVKCIPSNRPFRRINEKNIRCMLW